MSEFLGELSSQERIAKLQGLLRGMIDGGFSDISQMREFMDLCDDHTREFRGDREANLAFLESLDQSEVRFSEDTFDRIVYRHDDMVEGADFLTPVI